MNPDAYRIMWTIVMFDLPTETAGQRRNYALFRKKLLKSGFTMMQYSVYLRHAMSREHMLAHHKQVEDCLPPQGQVCLMTLTDKQFGQMKVYECAGKAKKHAPTEQLTLFDEEYNPTFDADLDVDL